MSAVAFVTIGMLVQYFYFMTQVGGARGRSGIKAPAMTGDENFERHLRVQMNTLEQLMIALPAMWLCAHFFRPDVAAIAGGAFILGRFLYGRAYVNDPSTRTVGMVIGMLGYVVMLLGTLWALLSPMF